MIPRYNPYDHYWDNGTDVFSSKTQTRVPYNDAAYMAWLALGNVATKDPGNGLLRDVLVQYDVGLSPAETATFADDKADLAALKSQAQAIIDGATTIINTPTPFTATQRDQFIKDIATGIRVIVKGLKRVYRRLT